MKRGSLSFLFLLFTPLIFSPLEAQPNWHSKLYNIYLCKGEINARLICDKLFPRMTPEEINDSFDDLRRMIRDIIIEKRGRRSEAFLTSILHVHGHLVHFVEDAQVIVKTKKVFVPRRGQFVPGTMPIMRYWEKMAREKGVELYCYKFIAACFDYLGVHLRVNLSFPCTSKKHLSDVESRWLYWLNKLGSKLRDHSQFGGYYDENIILFREVFAEWKERFDKIHESNRGSSWEGE
ncbi:hypothetical protein KAT92_03140 [Candidatus Babeliales bacterium]|nr:hypothetical protein [Candidatus Babeliales bacterium]